MSATEEQLDMIGRNGMDVSLTEFSLLFVLAVSDYKAWLLQHVTYIVIMFCLGFIIYLWSNLLISLYHNSGRNAPQTSKADQAGSGSSLWHMLVSGATAHYHGNGNASLEPKLDEYSALPNSGRTEDDDGSIELGTRSSFRQQQENNQRPVFDADIEGRDSDDDGGDSYWEHHDIEGAEELRLR
jgi:hypothetical protein